jgi:hypothetical protein
MLSSTSATDEVVEKLRFLGSDELAEELLDREGPGGVPVLALFELVPVTADRR